MVPLRQHTRRKDKKTHTTIMVQIETTRTESSLPTSDSGARLTTKIASQTRSKDDVDARNQKPTKRTIPRHMPNCRENTKAQKHTQQLWFSSKHTPLDIDRIRSSAGPPGGRAVTGRCCCCCCCSDADCVDCAGVCESAREAEADAALSLLSPGETPTTQKSLNVRAQEHRRQPHHAEHGQTSCKLQENTRTSGENQTHKTQASQNRGHANDTRYMARDPT